MTRGRHPVPEDQMPRFAGRGTFMKLPFYDPGHPSDIVILGVPFDGGTTFMPGTRAGPQAIRQASSTLYPFHSGYRFHLTERLSTSDGGDVFVDPINVGRTLDLIGEALARVPRQSKVVLLGGDHTITLASLRALKKRYGELSLVHLDAHPDLWDELWGEKYNHATVFRRAFEERLFNPATSIQVGCRGGFDHAHEDEIARELALTQIRTEEWFLRRSTEVAGLISRTTRGNPVYLSFDVDVVDPAFAPGTGTPEVGGPSSQMVLELLRHLKVNLVGADVVEVSPVLDHSNITALLGATVVYEILFLFADKSGNLVGAT